MFNKPRFYFRNVKRILRVEVAKIKKVYKTTVIFFHTTLGKKRVHFLHIGKTGGTAINYALKNHLITSRYVISMHLHGVKLRDIPNFRRVFRHY